MDFRVKGHSKYNLVKKDNIVVKSSTDIDERLVLSAKKQQNFKSSFFKTPDVLGITSSSFSMEYIEGKSFKEYFLLATKNDLDFLIKSLKGYFDESIVGKINVSSDIVKNKINSLNLEKNFVSLLNSTEPLNIWDFELAVPAEGNHYMVRLGDERKRGIYHCDSIIYPYIATAITKGKWNYGEYMTELDELFNEYGIVPFERGIA